MHPRRVTASQYDDEYFKRYVDQHDVGDINIPALYKPHTITLLIVTIIGLIIFVYSRDFNQSLEKNLFDGSIFMIAVFLLISTMILPNGLFIRPHPVIWRLTLGASYVYLLILIGTSFLTLQQAKGIMYYIAPDLKGLESAQILNKSYGVDCYTLTFERIWSDVDIFVVAHFFGWVVKALLMRHYVILWVQSINWEITELAFSHLMPNLNECWWDSIFFDVIICNGLGIHVGWMLCKWLEMKEYKWESITKMTSTKAKLKRAVLQFTPQSWTLTRWIEGDSSFKRAVMMSFLVIIWQIVELNSFLLKHIFVVKPSHFLTLSRLAFITLASAPSIRQYYQLTTNPHCRRMGSQLWVFLAILMVELLVCIKLGSQMFEKTIIINIFYWLTWLVISSFLLVYFCLWTMKDTKEDKNKMHVTSSDEEKELLDQKAKYCALCNRQLSLEEEAKKED